MYIKGSRVKPHEPHEWLNDILRDLHKQHDPKKANTVSLTPQAASKISRPSVKPGNLANSSHLSSRGNDLQEEPKKPAEVAGEDEEPRPKRAKRSETTTITNTSSMSTISPIGKSARVQPSRKARQPSNKPVASHRIEELQTLHMNPKIADQADADDVVDAQEAVDPNGRAKDASDDNSRLTGASPINIEVDLADTESFSAMRAILKERLASLEAKCKGVTWPKGPKEAASKNEIIVRDLATDLESQVELYSALRSSKIRGKAKATRDAETEAANALRNIISNAEKLTLKTQSTLATVYLNLIPLFVDNIVQGVDAYTTTEPISSASITEINLLLDSVYSLAKKAVSRPDDIQPKTMDMQSLRSAILEILPIIGAAQGRFSAELVARDNSNNRAEQAQMYAERERKIKQEAEKKEELERISAEQTKMQEEMEMRLKLLAESQKRKEAEGKRTRLNALHKRQWQALNSKMANSHSAKWITMGVARDNARTSTSKEDNHGTQSSEPARSSHPLATLDYEELVRNEKYASDDHKRAKLLTKSEEHPFARHSNESKIAFVDIMRSELGNIAHEVF